MRNTNVWRLIISLLLLSPFVGGLTWAQISNGKVYNFVNVANSGSSMTSTAGTNVSIAATLTSDYKQLWYVEEVSSGVYTLRNLGNGKYLRSSNATSGPWSMVSSIDDNCKFACSTVGAGYTLRATNDGSGYGYMHYGAGQGCVVCWESGAEATQWTISEVSVSASDLAANWAELDALNNTSANVGNYQTALNALFTDQSCSALKATYAAYTTAQMQADNNYKALPATLQAMVLKMTTDGTWEEANYDSGKSAWGADYAKKYRVQLYEPYNEVGEASSALGLNAHTNINNPTGIFVNNRGTVYVMVEGTIKDGASLYLTYYTGHGKLGNSYSDGVELHEGLNIVPYYADNCNLCINYVVHTFDTSDGKRGNQAKVRKLSDYADLKIHIEGGYINGYYNKMGDELYGSGDKNADWDYIEARATQKDVTVLGQYMTLQFPLNDADTEGNKGLGTYFNELVNIESVINEWDNVMLWERLVLGVLDKKTIEGNAKKSPYSDKDYVFAYTGDDTDGFGTDYGDYYNVHGLAFGVGGDAYMYGGWDHCGYHYNTMGGVILNLPTDAGSHWGPGHEIGHQHQELLNMRGLTEVTNNLFVNVVLWYFGETTSRYNGNQGSLTNVLEQYNAEGTDFFSNNIWAQTIMYYKLFLYYHVLGNNPKFYPRLFEMLRQDPMNIAYEQDGSKCLMHFYKKCCLASGDDLTEFFRAHGFFEVMENRFVGDYSSAVYNLTQNQIDAAIEEVKSWGYPENLAVLFVNDATGETIKSNKGDNLELYGETTVCAEVGSYASYTSANVASEYTYTVSGNTITMEGTGGVGFAILNADGEIIGFSDKTTFEISNECAALIASGEAKVVVTNYDNSEPVVATDIMSSGGNDEQYEVLGELLESAKVIVDLSDDTGTKVGWYRKESIATLNTAYTAAKSVYDNMTVDSYKTVYNNLLQAYIDVQGDEYAKIGIVEGTAYRLVNKAYPNRSMAVDVKDVDTDTSVDEMFGLTTESSDAQLWYFEAGSTSGTYYLKNKSTSKYPGNVSSGSVLSADKTATSGDAAAYAYTFHDLGDGTWAFSGNTGLHCASSQSYNIVGWGWGSDTPASHWYITAVEPNEVANKRAQLEELIAKTKDLVDEMSVVTYRGDLDMSQYRISSNATESGHETNYLVDNNNDTYFHTVWRDSEVAENHYFQIDLGDGESLSEFVLKYTTYTTGWTADLPTTIVVTASTDGELWNDITTLTNLPTTQGTDYTSAVLGDGSTSYRYWRFTVTGTSSGGSFNGYKYFGLAEVKLNIPETQVHKIQTKYTSYLETSVLTTACDEIVDAVSVYDNTEATAETYQTAYNDLYAEYEKLLDAYTNAKSASLAAKKQELQTLIDNTNTLMAECGTVNYTPGTYDGTPKLQSTDDSENFYIWTNAQSTVEGPIKDLVDGDNSTYFHSDYSGANSNDGLDHHITVNLGTFTASSFTFNYVTRHNAETNYPATIAVYGSVDGTSYGDPLHTFTDLPTDKTQSYTSTAIESETKFKYLRFMVTATNNNNKQGGHPIFHMAEFGLTINGTPDNYAVELGASVGEVTEELMISVYRETASATATLENATTELQLIQAIAALQAQYEALAEAKGKFNKQELIDLVTIATTKLNECGTVTPNGEALDVTLNEQAGSVNKNMLRELYRAIETAQGVINNANATQEEFVAAKEALSAQIEIVNAAQQSTAKAELKAAIDAAQAAIDACASSITQENGEYTVVWKSETAGDVDKATLIAAYEALVQANAVYNGDASAVSEYQAAKEALNTPIATLNEYKEGYHKAQLKSMVDLLTALIEKCNTEGQGDLTAGMLEEMVQINETATAYLTQEFATHEVLVSTIEGAISDIETNYPTWSAAQQSTAKQDLLAKIEQLQNLIDECRATGTKIITTDVPCALQTTSPNAPFYLSTNATDSEGVIANLVDGKMNTFFQTKSGVGEEHYLLVDAGDGNALKKFKFSYRTNKSFFPYTIVVYGSNDNTNFIPLATKFSKDDNVNPLPTSADQLWISSEIVSETAYRYLRFNVTELGLALNVDGDKEIDTSKGEQLSNKYRNSLASSNATPSQVLECCFAMSEFDLISRVDEEGVTEEQLTPAEEAIAEANDLANNSANATELSEMKNDLETCYEDLSVAFLAASQRIQVTLTTTDAKRDELLSGIEFGQTIGTFSAPYATVIPEGVTAYYAEQEYEGGTVSLTPIEEGMALPAEQGVILMGEVGVNTVMFIPATDETEADLSANTFSHSATSSVVMESNDYILANGGQGIGFYHATPGSTLKQRKAFFRLPAGAAPLSLVLKFGGNTTDLDIIGTDMDNVDEPIFDIYGRQVTQILKGRVYIKNGKKFIAK